MNTYTLEDYNRLAYEFAIRNPRVIEILKSKPLTDETAEELLNTFGINIKVVMHPNKYDENSDPINSYEEIEINSLEELCLDYPHLAGVKGYESSGYYENDYSTSLCKKLKTIHQPKSKFRKLESGDVALKRIHPLIETRGKKLERLMSGEAFRHYDEVIFENRTIYAIDPSGNKKQTINTDIGFIGEWIEPSKYLQLLPQYNQTY